MHHQRLLVRGPRLLGRAQLRGDGLHRAPDALNCGNYSVNCGDQQCAGAYGQATGCTVKYGTECTTKGSACVGAAGCEGVRISVTVTAVVIAVASDEGAGVFVSSVIGRSRLARTGVSVGLDEFLGCGEASAGSGAGGVDLEVQDVGAKHKELDRVGADLGLGRINHDDA